MKVGLAKMVSGSADKAKSEASKSEDDAETKALRQVIDAIKDWDDKGAVAALKVAIRACIKKVEEDEEDGEDEGYLVSSSAPDEDD